MDITDTEYHSTPLPKIDPVKMGETGLNEKIYPHTQMHLGSLIHLAIADELKGNNWREHPYLEHLRGLDEGLAKSVEEGVKKLSKEITVNLTSKEVGKETIWLSEVPFRVSAQQVETIENVLSEKDKYQKIAEALGYKSVNALGVGVLTDPEYFTKLKDNEKILGDEKEFTEIKKFSNALMGYYYFDFSHIHIKPSEKLKSDNEVQSGSVPEFTEFDIEKIPERIKKLVASTSTTTDLIGLTIDKSDDDAKETINEFQKLLTEGLNISLLDFQALGEDKKTTLNNLILLIEEGKVSINIAEIKCMFQSDIKTREGLKKIGFDKDTITDVHVRDISHTLWSMFQLLSSLKISTEQTTRDSENVKIALQKSGNAGEDRFKLLRESVAYTNQFIQNPNGVKLVRIFWPVIDIDGKDTSPFFGISSSSVTATLPDYSINEFDEKDLVRLRKNTVKYGRIIGQRIEYQTNQENDNNAKDTPK
ncbi:MAG TPA: hypothetical protein VI819_02920 [Patescibacteria group bacterium]|nr:hypothetical protein [Patescibacteria group bacterium]